MSLNESVNVYMCKCTNEPIRVLAESTIGVYGNLPFEGYGSRDYWWNLYASFDSYDFTSASDNHTLNFAQRIVCYISLNRRVSTHFINIKYVFMRMPNLF